MTQKNQTNFNKILYFLVTVIFLFSFNLYSSAFLSEIAQVSDKTFSGLELTYMENTGAAFSMFQNNKFFLIGFAIFAILVILWYLFKHIAELSMMSIFVVSLLLTGISCNLYERIVYGFVRDYFELTFINFPIFNISDVFINISVVAIIYMLFTKSYSETKNELKKH